MTSLAPTDDLDGYLNTEIMSHTSGSKISPDIHGVYQRNLNEKNMKKESESGDTALIIPDDIDDGSGKGKESELQKRSGLVFIFKYAIVLMLLSLAMFGCSIPLLIRLKDYEALRQPLVEIGSPVALNLALPYFLFIAVFGVFLSSLCAFWGNHKRSYRYVYLGMVVALVSSTLAILVSYRISSLLDGLLSRLESNPIIDDFSELELDVVTLTSVIFNECCMNLYDNRNYTFGDIDILVDDNGVALDDTQRKVPICGESVASTCPFREEDGEIMFPEIVTDIVNEFSFGADLLCLCYTSQEDYDELKAIYERDDLCSSYRGLVINNGGNSEIPVIKESFNGLLRLLGQFQRPEFGPRLPVGKMTVVGKPLPPEQLYNEPSEDIGFSCGIGYAKGLSFQVYLYVNEATEPLIVGSFVCSGLVTFFTLGLITFWTIDYIFIAEEYDEFEENEYDAYDAVAKPKKSSVINNGGTKIKSMFSRTQRSAFSGPKKKAKVQRKQSKTLSELFEEGRKENELKAEQKLTKLI